MRKLICGFALSLDGFIEGPQGEYDWIIMDKDHFRELQQSWKETDAMLYGRKTYEVLISHQNANKGKNPFAHMKHYVLSRSLNEVQPGFTLLGGDTHEEVMRLKSMPGRNIAVFGGALLVSSLINLDLIDELNLVYIPVLLGEGKPFFVHIAGRKNFRLKEVRTFPATGLVSVTYARL